MATGGFTKKTVDIEALMAQAAAEEKAAAEAAASGKKKKKDKAPKESKSKKKPSKSKDTKGKKDKKDKKEKKGKKERKKRSKKNKDDALEPREIFGVPLQELVLEDGDMPEVFTDLITCLEGHATETQGLFRKTAPVSEVDRLIQRYHAGEDIDWNDIDDKHLVGGVLMAFLLRLPEPLITFSAYDRLITIVSSDKDKEAQLKEMKGVVRSLPELRYAMLETLLDFLDTMTRDSDDNMMTSENLAICFGPGLLRREEENLAQLMKESSMVTGILTALIDQYGYFFRDEEVEDDDDSGTASARSMERADTDYTAFAEAAKKNLANVSKELSELLTDLEWEKLWKPEPLAHAAIMEDFLSKILADEVVSVSDEVVKNEIADSLPYQLKDIKGRPMAESCKDLREKFLKHRATIEDTRVLIEQQGSERDVVLSTIKISKNSTILLRVIAPKIERQAEVSSADVSDVKSSVPSIKKELSQLKVKLDTCENYNYAAVLSRLIRAVQKGLKERSKAPIEDIDYSVPDAAPTAKDKMKIQNLQDALEFSFPVCIKALTQITAELDDPSKQAEASRSSDLLVAVDNALKKFKKLGLSEKAPAGAKKAVPSVSLTVPPPAAPHPRSPRKGDVPPPMAAHPASRSPRSNGVPPPMAAHPASRSKSAGGSVPPPVAAHPRSGGAPPPAAPHPASRGAVPPPAAPHPRSGAAPPPMAPHPSATRQVSAPGGSARPRQAIPPPMAPHPSK